MITPLDRIRGVRGSLSMLWAVLISTDVLRKDSSEIVDELEGNIEDLDAAISELQKFMAPVTISNIENLGGDRK